MAKVPQKQYALACVLNAGMDFNGVKDGQVFFGVHFDETEHLTVLSLPVRGINAKQVARHAAAEGRAFRMRSVQ